MHFWESSMNTANLQLQGILLAMYALLDSFKDKGVLNQHEIEQALETAEANALADATRVASSSDAKAILFPIRFLRCANTAATTPESFTTISLSSSAKLSRSSSRERLYSKRQLLGRRLIRCDRRDAPAANKSKALRKCDQIEL
jgi:hypothetical protein